jgi:hypothetical protein
MMRVPCTSAQGRSTCRCVCKEQSAEDVLHGYASYQQGVCDERTVAAPRQCLGAHQGDMLSERQFQQFLKTLLELRCQHVIGISLKRGVPPARVR